MDKEIYRIMQDAYKEYGNEVFLDNRRLHAYLQDLLAAYPTELKRITLAINENIFSKVIIELTEDNKSRLNLYSAILVDNYSIQPEVAEEIVNLIYYTVFGETSKSTSFTTDKDEARFKNELVNQLISMGDLMFAKGLLKEAYSQYLEIAKNNNSAAAQWRVAECLKHGWGIKIDKNKSMDYYLQSAEQGYPMAEHYMASNTPKEDVEKHFQTLERLARDCDLPAAYYTLSKLYAEGVGCKKDFEKSIELIKIAADKNYYWAMCNMRYRFSEGLEETKERLQKWRKKHNNIGDSYRCMFLEYIENEFSY